MSTVTQIHTVTGARGGEAWILDLDCGHVAVRAKPKFHIWRLWSSPNRWLAPKRVRCPVCGPAARREEGSRG